MKKTTFLIAFMLAFICSIKSYAQTTYYSAATATDFNNVSSWGTGTDGTGASPASISNADNFVIANNAVLTLTGNAAVRQLTINAGALSIASNVLTVSRASTFDSTFAVNAGGSFTQSGGTLTVNGNVNFANNSNFTQTGGNIVIDGNNGGATTGSVAASTPIFSIGGTGSYSTGTIALTGGTITIVDPHTAATSSTGYALYVNFPSRNVEVGAGHTISFGDGVSTDAGGHASGFFADPYVDGGRMNFGNVVVNNPSGTNRIVVNPYSYGIHGNANVLAGELRPTGGFTLRGNLNVSGTATLTMASGFILAIPVGTSSSVNTVGQVLNLASTAVLRNSATTVTANLNSLLVNNNSAAGVTFAGTSNIATNPLNSLSVSGTLTFTTGKLVPALGASFVLGTATPSAGTLSFTSGGFATGTTFNRWFAAAGTGSSFTAGTDTTTSTSRYPFVNASGQDRSAWIERTTPVGAAGILGVTYVNTPGYAAVTATDGAVAVDTKSNDTWAVAANGGTPLAAASFKFQAQAPGLFGGPLANASTRVIQGTAFVGTHQNGTATPGGQRTGITPAELTAAPFSLAIVSTDIPFASIASGDWNNPATWNKNLVPSCTDVVNIAAGTIVTVNSAANVSKNVNILQGGTLTIASGDLTVGCTLNNNTLINTGTLNITGGTLTLNGNFDMVNGSNLSQSGGNFIVDGNAAGVVASSVASGTPIFRIGTSNTSYSSGLISLTGGNITIVDPHTATSASSGYAFYVNFPSGFNVEASAAHTLNLGDGVSADAGGHANGFYVESYIGSGRINLGTVRVNNPTGTNRIVTTQYAAGIHGNLFVLAGDFRPVAYTVEGNVSVTGGTYIANATLTFAAPLGISSVVNPAAQTIGFTAPGVIKNATTAETANLTSFTINNSNAAGVTLLSPLSASGVLTLTSGVVNTTATNLLTSGTATVAGTVTGGSATAYVNGPLARTIGTNNATTSFINFPVGKTAYAPVAVAPTTTAVSVFKAEAFDANAGTADASIINLAAARRWEAAPVSGTFTDVKVRVGDAAIAATNIPVMAPTAGGAYASSFGSVATFAAGTPSTTTAINAVTAANYTGFLSFADSNLCSGTPAPGATIVSTAVICAGESVNLSVQNTTTGSGVTYQWQSSADGVTYADITGATATTYTTVPAASLYYRLSVTCSAGPATATSTPVQVTFSNNVTATTPAARCGAGIVTLGATGSAGSTLAWYAAATGGAPLTTGATFTTPSITETTTYYVAAQSEALAPVAGGKLAPESSWDGYVTNDWGIVFNALQAVTVNSVDVFSSSAGTLSVKITNAAGTELFASAIVNVAAGGLTTPTTIPLNFAVPAGTGYRILVKSYSGVSLIRGSSNLAFPYANSNISVTSSEFGGTTTGTYYFFYNIRTTSSCSSARVPVVATVTAPPALTLASNTATICAASATPAVALTAGATEFDTYVWSPATGVTGSAAAGWVFNPTVTTTYTLTATQSAGSACVNSTTFQVNVNPQPTAIVVPATLEACEGGTLQITATGGVVANTIFQENFNAASTQFSTATTSGTAIAEANATYFSEGTGSVLFNTSSNSADVSYGVNSNINLAGYASAQLTFSHIVGMEGNTYSYDIGYVQYSSDGGTTWTTFPTTSYAGNGTLITTQGTTTAVTGTIFSSRSYTDWNARFTSATVNPGTAPAASLWKTETINVPVAALTAQFRVRFRYTTDSSALYYGWLIDNVNVVAQSSQIAWSPATNVFTDAQATQPYQAGAFASTIYVRPTAATTYTATAVNPGTGCNTSSVVSVTITSTPAPVASAQTFCGTATVASLQATGTSVQWYAAATGGTALAATTALATATTYYATQTLNGCESTTRTPVVVTINTTAVPTASAQTFCNTATVSQLQATGTAVQWYSAATGGTALTAETPLATGNYYVSQTLNSCESARVEVSITVNVTAAPTVAAATLAVCNSGSVADLVATGTSIQWYAAATGGTALAGTTAFTEGTTTYYASQTINGCESLTRAAVAVTLNITDAPVAAAAQTFCNEGVIAGISATGGDIKWYATATGGSALEGDVALVSGTTYYGSATVAGCESVSRTAVTVTISVVSAPDLDDVTACSSYTLAALTSGAYYTQQGGAGTAVAAGTPVNQTTTFYVFVQQGTCTDETSFTVTITNTPAPTAVSPQVVAVTEGPATIEDIAVDAQGTVVWYLTEANAMAGTDAIPAGTVLTVGTYYATQTVDGCTSTDILEVVVSEVLGVKGFDAAAFSFYPNPVSNVLNLQYSAEITSVAIFNLVGQQVLSVQPNATNAKVDMTPLAEGTYLVTVKAGAATKTIKVVKKLQ